jgi:hypothetical protein
MMDSINSIADLRVLGFDSRSRPEAIVPFDVAQISIETDPIDSTQSSILASNPYAAGRSFNTILGKENIIE